MYEKLKQIMREAGYEVSEGAEWLATDMQHFVTFSRHVLGSTTPHLNHMLAYPGAFPHVIARAEELAKGVITTIEHAVEHAVEDVVEAFEPSVPETPPVEPVTAPQSDSSVLDVSAAGQTDKQDLNDAPPPAVPQSDTQEQSADQPAAQAAEGTEQSTEDAGQLAEGQPNEGQPQE